MVRGRECLPYEGLGSLEKRQLKDEYRWTNRQLKNQAVGINESIISQNMNITCKQTIRKASRIYVLKSRLDTFMTGRTTKYSQCS